MQFCKSNTADRIPSTKNFAVAKLIEFSMKLIRVNEAHHSGLVPELITKIKIISHWGSELKWYPNRQKTTNKAPSPKTSNQPLLEPMRINEVDNKEFVPKGIPAFIEACFEVTQTVPQENRRPKNFCTTPENKTLRKLMLKNEVSRTLSNIRLYSHSQRDTLFC